MHVRLYTNYIAFLWRSWQCLNIGVTADPCRPLSGTESSTRDFDWGEFSPELFSSCDLTGRRNSIDTGCRKWPWESAQSPFEKRSFDRSYWQGTACDEALSSVSFLHVQMHSIRLDLQCCECNYCWFQLAVLELCDRHGLGHIGTVFWKNYG